MKIDMSAFVGREFDCEFFNDDIEVYIAIGKLRTLDAHSCANTTDYFDHCRPRLNKPQVLDDWSWIPDGLIWNSAHFINGEIVPIFHAPSSYLGCIKPLWVECIGLQKGYEHEGMEMVE